MQAGERGLEQLGANMAVVAMVVAAQGAAVTDSARVEGELMARAGGVVLAEEMVVV